ncbi:hypothetical protein MOV66_16285 [Agrobacterium sp. SHOUNA12C]|jgi:hypothetical protein|nr:hypothetical protein [Agrobacterium sp. BETTINA12B]MCJ9758210.1 hypothetical protein [Agrobacterium sp. SHOUNA12C]
MTLSLDARLQMIGPISDDDKRAVLPTVAAWAERANNVSRFANAWLTTDLSPITAFVSSEARWHRPD